MRALVIALGCVFIVACTADVTGYKTPISQRVTEACSELDGICAATGDCSPKLAFCGPKTAVAMANLFVIEDTCKTACLGTRTCIKDCKATRTANVSTFLARTSTTDGGVAGDGSSACADLSNTCATSGTGCDANEFFCTAAARAPSSCSTELDQCKAACNHDRTCTHACRDAYKQCLASTTTPDAGMPTTSYNLTYGTTAGSTGTGTVTVNPAGASCGASCASYAAGTMVTLTATPSTGSTFTKWVGCTSTTNKCTVTMTSAMTVTATFTKTVTYTYTTDIAPKMTGYCNGCHSGGGALPGNYATDSYAGLLGNGSDTTPNIIPGDVNSLFVQKMIGNHKNVLTVYPGFDKIASDWVVLNAAAK